MILSFFFLAILLTFYREQGSISEEVLYTRLTPFSILLHFKIAKTHKNRKK